MNNITEIIPRKIYPKIINSIEKNKITVLIGSRQVGKTTLLKTVLDEYHKKNIKTLYIDLENPKNLIFLESTQDFTNYLKTQQIDCKADHAIIAFDEFYLYPNITKFFKILHSKYPNLKILASGSSSIEIKKHLKESLAGRLHLLTIYPISLQEALKVMPALSSFSQDIASQKDLYKLDNFRNAIEDCLVFGNYPRVINSKTDEAKIEEIGDIYQTYIQKDVRSLLSDINVVSYNKMLKVLASQIGNLLNISEVSNTLNISRKEVEKFLFILENTFIIKLITPFFTNMRKSLTKSPKIYFIDNGMCNYAINNFSNISNRLNIGAIVENYVLQELLKNRTIKDRDINFFRTTSGTEVDFILQTVDIGQIPMEVKFKSFVKPIIPRALKEFVSAHKSKLAFIFTKDFEHIAVYLDCTYHFIPFWKVGAWRQYLKILPRN